jgi:Zn-finger nucleic acid-binding protein
MNTEQALHCSGCGRDLGLEPVGAAGALACPHCKSALETFPVGKGGMHDCAQCGGQFLDHDAFRHLVDEHNRPRVAEGPRSRRAVALDRVRYVPCPACHALMNRKNFGTTSGVILDVCKLHGTWFDLGELPSVLAFIEDGGLERERARKLEEAAHEAADARRKAVAAASFGGQISQPVQGRQEDFADMLSFIMHQLIG